MRTASIVSSPKQPWNAHGDEKNSPAGSDTRSALTFPIAFFMRSGRASIVVIG